MRSNPGLESCRGRDRMVVGCVILLMAECTGYNFISDLRRVGTNKTDCHDIAEILLKVFFSTTTRNENDVYNVLYA